MSNVYHTPSNLDSAYLIKLYSVINENQNIVTFLHNTPTKQNADNILENGFKFQGHLDYTSDIISSKDIIGLKYFSQIRKHYGNYTIIIQISKKIITEYTERLKNTEYHFSEALTAKPPSKTCDDEFTYCLSPNFIKGYLNIKNADFVLNQKFNPSLKIKTFEENIEKLILLHKKNLSHK